jgi:hypothetical protein
MREPAARQDAGGAIARRSGQHRNGSGIDHDRFCVPNCIGPGLSAIADDTALDLTAQ